MIAAQPPQATRAGRKPLTIVRVLSWVLIALVWLGGLICLFPLGWTLVASFRPDSSFLSNPMGFNPHEFIGSNYSAAFTQADFGTGFKHSVVQVGIILISTLFFCPLAGYGFAKFSFRGRNFLFGLMLLTLFFVPITQYIPLLIELNNLGWIDTYQGLVVPLVISSLGIFWMNGVIAGIPNELLHAARVDGCGSFSTWWRIVMPVIRPALVSLAIFTFLGAYNDYFWPLLIAPGLQTIQPILAGLQTALLQSAMTTSSSWGTILAGSVVVFAPTVLVFLVMQRFFLRGVLQGSLKE
ncbi:MAG: carbohydrate ABC transporter permease [Chloroflexota bacterium]